MLKFQDELGNYYQVAYYYKDDKWMKIYLDGDEIICDLELLEMASDSIGGRYRYYLQPKLNSKRLKLIEI